MCWFYFDIYVYAYRLLYVNMFVSVCVFCICVRWKGSASFLFIYYVFFLSLCLSVSSDRLSLYFLSFGPSYPLSIFMFELRFHLLLLHVVLLFSVSVFNFGLPVFCISYVFVVISVIRNYIYGRWFGTRKLWFCENDLSSHINDSGLRVKGYYIHSHTQTHNTKMLYVNTV